MFSKGLKYQKQFFWNVPKCVLIWLYIYSVLFRFQFIIAKDCWFMHTLLPGNLGTFLRNGHTFSSLLCFIVVS